MQTHQRTSHSMVTEFTKQYLLVSIIPVVLFFLFSVTGGLIAKQYISGLIYQETRELNADAEAELESVGQQIIRVRARDAALQVATFLALQPNLSISTLQQSTLFREIAMQSVGKTGYVCLYEAGTGIMRLHPNPGLVDREMVFLADDIPSWWGLFKRSLPGKEVSGYYDWIDPDGSVRKKYMTMTPVGVPLMGKTLMVAATTYIDEFSAPVAAMEAKASATHERIDRFFSKQITLAIVIMALFLSGLFCCVYLIGRRAALHYMRPIVELAGIAEKVGDGAWQRSVAVQLLEREDEIGILARSFESMRIQLHKIFMDLEDRLAELKETQQSLEESEAHFRGLYDGVPVGLYRTTFSGRVVDANPTLVRMLGFPSKELFLSKRAEEMYVNREDRFKWQTVIEVSGVNNVHEVRMRRYDQSVIWVENHSRTVRGLDGSILYVEGSLIDISDRKEMEKQLQMAQRMEAIGTLAGGLAHDFNNLMMGILGNASIMLLDIDTDHPHYAKLKKIETLVQSGSKLTSQLLGYARKGKVELNAFDLNAIVSDSVDVFARTRKEITVHMDLSSGPVSIKADYSQIEQVLLNLFINAADAMPDGGDLRLTTTTVRDTEMEAKPYKIKSGRYSMLRIADSGHGMDPETQNRVFDPFFTTKEMGRGTGLGLASAYGIIKAHAGYIDVDSVPGKGSVFTIYLPLTTEENTHASNGGPGIHFGKGTILIVDDEEMVLEVAIEMVRKMGYDVLAATAGDEAISLFKDQADAIDLVVLDLIMPRTSGKDTFEKLKRIRPDIKILLASGYSLDGQAKALMDRGCDGFIQKPYQLDDFSAIIDDILNR